MDENNKYYTPDISDLFIGYECEKESCDKDGCDIWVNHKIGFDYGWLEIPENYNERLRTKYLDKEDVKSLGWEYYKTLDFSNNLYKDIREFYRIPVKNDNLLKGFYWELLPNYENKTVSLYLCSENNENGKMHFSGKCLSINELKKIMKYLNIPTNG